MSELAPYLRMLAHYRGRLALGALLMLATVAAGIGLLALSGWFITATGVTALLLAAGTAARLEVFLPGAGIRFFALARTAARYFERIHNHDAVLRLLADLRTRVFARLTPLDPAALARFRSATILNRLTADIDALDSLYLRSLAPPLVALLGILGIGALIALFDASSAALASLFLLVGMGAVGGIAAARGIRLGEAVTMRLEHAREASMDLVRGLAELRAFGALARQRKAIDACNEELLVHQIRAARLTAAGEAAAGLVVHAGLALTLLLAVGLHARGAIDGPIIALMALAVLALAEGLAPVPGGLLQLGRVRAAARRLNHQTATAALVVDPPVPQPIPAGNDLSFEDVRVHHGHTTEPALADFCLRIDSGERVALLGPSGCGKSTVADLAARLRDPDHGSVRLGGEDLRTLELAALHGRISYLTQRTEILADSIAANLRLARSDADNRALWDALERVDLADFVDSLPDGLGTWVGENGMRLSGGQSRRLALARIILRDTPIVLLDEPLAGLDDATSGRVARNLEDWLTGRTALLCAHEARALPGADRHVHLTPGDQPGDSDADRPAQ